MPFFCKLCIAAKGLKGSEIKDLQPDDDPPKLEEIARHMWEVHGLRVLDVQVEEEGKGIYGHVLNETLNPENRKNCPKCGKDYRHWHVENYDAIWRDGEVVCECGQFIRYYDAG